MKKAQKEFVLLLCLLLLFALYPMQIKAATTVKLNKTKVSMYVGDMVKLKITGTKKKITWTTLNKRIASVNSNGKVTGKAVGETTIKAKVAGKTLSCTVIVKNVLNVDKSSIEIKDYGSIIVSFRGSGTVSYHVDGTDIISCSWDKGDWVNYKTKLYITGKKNGIAYIYITNTQNNEEVSIKVTVNKGTEENTSNRNSNNDIEENSNEEFSVSIELPITPITLHEYSYKNEIQQTYTISGIRYETEYYSYKDEFNVILYFDGLKTYDYRGSGQSSKAKIGWKLYDENSNVVDSDTCYSPALAEGEKFKDAYDYIFNLKRGSYRLEILSVN